jgi:hypothetical protein
MDEEIGHDSDIAIADDDLEGNFKNRDDRHERLEIPDHRFMVVVDPEFHRVKKEFAGVSHQEYGNDVSGKGGQRQYFFGKHGRYPDDAKPCERKKEIDIGRFNAMPPGELLVIREKRRCGGFE